MFTTSTRPPCPSPLSAMLRPDNVRVRVIFRQNIAKCRQSWPPGPGEQPYRRPRTVKSPQRTNRRAGNRTAPGARSRGRQIRSSASRPRSRNNPAAMKTVMSGLPCCKSAMNPKWGRICAPPTQLSGQFFVFVDIARTMVSRTSLEL